jgi:hypothetical protein
MELVEITSGRPWESRMVHHQMRFRHSLKSSPLLTTSLNNHLDYSAGSCSVAVAAVGVVAAGIPV